MLNYPRTSENSSYGLSTGTVVVHPSTIDLLVPAPLYLTLRIASAFSFIDCMNWASKSFSAVVILALERRDGWNILKLFLDLFFQREVFKSAALQQEQGMLRVRKMSGWELRLRGRIDDNWMITQGEWRRSSSWLRRIWRSAGIVHSSGGVILPYYRVASSRSLFVYNHVVWWRSTCLPLGWIAE